jgi:hypothetical protein
LTQAIVFRTGLAATAVSEADLDRRWHPLVLIIVAGLSVLVVHLVAYPWP